MKILVVSGFLGAGKTTFIKKMSEKTEYDFCVFENEYAQADIDKTLLSQTGNMKIWELTENCICCSGKQDFASTVLTISNTIDPEYLIVEPTGVAKLSSILDNLKKIEYERISLLAPITILDGTNLNQEFSKLSEIYLDQIRTSKEIILSKMENADSDEKERVVAAIRQISPEAEIITEHYSKMNQDWWLKLLERNLDGSSSGGGEENQSEEAGKKEDAPGESHLHHHHSEDELENMTLTEVSLPTPVHLIAFLEMVTFGVYGKVCRAKGFLPCGDLWLQFDIVNTVYSITEIAPQPESRAVFMGENLNRTDIRRIFFNSENSMYLQETCGK